MNNEPRIRLRIPDPEDFDEEGPPHFYIPVPTGVVDSGIDLLHCLLVQRKREEGMEADDEVWDRLAVCAAQMLSGLTAAWAAYYHGSGVRELVAQIDHFCTLAAADAPPEQYDSSRDRRLRDFAALRQDARTTDIVDALEALRLERRRRRTEHKQQQAAAKQGPATERDPGWEF